MSENEFEFEEETKPKKFQLRWFLPVLAKPKKTMAEIATAEHAIWLAPLLALMVTALILVLVSAPILGKAALSATPPDWLPYYGEETQQQYQDAVKMSASPVTTVLFPLLGKFLGIWVGWILLGSIFHMALTLNGSRTPNLTALNIVSWSSVPFIFRDLVQIVAILVTKQLILKPGLSGFFADGATGFAAFLAAMFAFIDLYLIWQFVLMGLAAMNISGIKSGKAWLAVLIAVIVFLVIKALPKLLMAQFSGLSTGGFYF